MRSPTDNLQSGPLAPEAIESRLDGDSRPVLAALRRLARDRALPVYLVGGPVRDLLLGLPVQDLDFVVVGEAQLLAGQLAGQLAEQWGGQVVTHPRFGTATVVRGGVSIDLVAARREVYPRPGALPRVYPGSIYDDLARRDFTVNALALPLLDEQPRLLDPHGGAEDLRREIIRTLHPESFADDPTRLLRAARYEPRLGFRLAPDTEIQLGEAVAQGCLDTVSGDRLRHELERILAEEQPGRALIRAMDWGILPGIHPALSRADGLTRWAWWSAEMPRIAPERGPGSAAAGPLTWLAALVYTRSAGEGEGVIRRLNMPNAWAQVVRDTIAVAELERELADPSRRPSQLCRLLARRDPAAIYAVAGLTGSLPVRRRLLRYLFELRQVAPRLNGRDLLALGVPPGPPVGRMLARLRAARQDGRVHTEDGERRLVGEWLRAGGG